MNARNPNAREADLSLPLPAARCLSRIQAAEYLAIGTTLLNQLPIAFFRIGKRRIYDRSDLDAWLVDVKTRQAATQTISEPWQIENQMRGTGSTGAPTPSIGGLRPPSRVAIEYAAALGLSKGQKLKRCLPK